MHPLRLGPLQLFRREAAWTISGLARVDRFAFDVEMLFLAQRLGWNRGSAGRVARL
jgi:hypothetical protein